MRERLEQARKRLAELEQTPEAERPAEIAGSIEYERARITHLEAMSRPER